MEKQKKWAGWLIAAVIVIVAAVALALGNNEPSGENGGALQSEAELRELFPEADAGAAGFESLDNAQDSLTFTYAAKKDGQVIGHALKQTVQGYAGPIEVITGLASDGTVRGVRVGGPEFNETENLGAKARDASFTDQFQGKTPPLALGEEIDAISGATVTSRAVTDGVNNAAERLNTLMGTGAPITSSAPDTTAQGRTANASAIGYGGPVLVRLTLDDAGAITALDVGGVRFEETEGVGSRVREPAFTQSFIGKTPPLELNTDIDAISGATVSSQAVVDAVNEAAEFLKQE